MVKCGKCSNKIGIFQHKYNYTDDDGKSIKYCEDCNNKWVLKEEKKKLKEEKKKEKEKEVLRINKEKERNELLEQLLNDPLVVKFSKEYSFISLSLSNNKFNCLPPPCTVQNVLKFTTTYQLFEMGKIEYAKFINIFVEGQISQFIQILDVDVNSIRNYLKDLTRLASICVIYPLVVIIVACKWAQRKKRKEL